MTMGGQQRQQPIDDGSGRHGRIDSRLEDQDWRQDITPIGTESRSDTPIDGSSQAVNHACCIGRKGIVLVWVELGVYL